MPTQHFASTPCFSHFSMHLFVTHEDTREIHHLTQTDDPWPGHCLCNFCWSQSRSWGFQSRGRRYTGRHLNPHMNWLMLGFINHELDTIQTEDIRDLMRINKHSGCAVRYDCTHNLRDGQHPRLDMHMTIK